MDNAFKNSEHHYQQYLTNKAYDKENELDINEPYSKVGISSTSFQGVDITNLKQNHILKIFKLLNKLGYTSIQDYKDSAEPKQDVCGDSVHLDGLAKRLGYSNFKNFLWHQLTSNSSKVEGKKTESKSSSTKDSSLKNLFSINDAELIHPQFVYSNVFLKKYMLATKDEIKAMDTAVKNFKLKVLKRFQEMGKEAIITGSTKPQQDFWYEYQFMFIEHFESHALCLKPKGYAYLNKYLYDYCLKISINMNFELANNYCNAIESLLDNFPNTDPQLKLNLLLNGKSYVNVFLSTILSVLDKNFKQNNDSGDSDNNE